VCKQSGDNTEFAIGILAQRLKESAITDSSSCYLKWEGLLGGTCDCEEKCIGMTLGMLWWWSGKKERALGPDDSADYCTSLGLFAFVVKLDK
jgi:hypothetical protein